MSEKFDDTYVKKLREENAKWRNQVRELEAQNETAEVQVELAKQGIVADPRWVSVNEGQSVEDAVSKMKEEYPHLAQTVTPTTEKVDVLDFELELPVEKPKVKPLAPATQLSTTPKPARATRINSRNIAEIRKDPVARSKIRDAYRGLLLRSSNQGES